MSGVLGAAIQLPIVALAANQARCRAYEKSGLFAAVLHKGDPCVTFAITI